MKPVVGRRPVPVKVDRHKGFQLQQYLMTASKYSGLVELRVLAWSNLLTVQLRGFEAPPE